MKLVLVSIHIDKTPQAFPLAGAMLAANINTTVDTSLIDLYLEDSLSFSVESILNGNPDIIGFSVYLWNVERVFALAENIKEIQPGISIIAGGPEVTADAFNFDHKGLFNNLFSGEGENILKDYLEIVLSRKTAPKLFDQTTALDVTSLSSPFLKRTIDITGYDGILWELSRGCIFNCSFCFESRGIRKVRNFPLKRIEKELKLFADSGIKQIFVLDPTFNLDPERAKEILRMIIKTAPDIHFTFEIRSEFLDRETAELFASITCSIQLGLQSARPEVLKNVNRNLNRKDFYEKILLLHEEGVIYGFDLIYGLPGDTYAGFCESLDFALSLHPNHLDIFPLAVLKGTELYDTAEKFEIKYRNSDPYTVLSTPGFGDRDMQKAADLAKACDIFYNNGESVPWFTMILDSLQIKSSVFLEKFVEFLKEKNYSALKSDEFIFPVIIEIQTEFILQLFETYNMKKEGNAAADCINWFNSCSIVRHSDENRMERTIRINYKDYTYHNNFIIRNFRFNIEQFISHLEMNIQDLTEIAHFTENTPCTALIFPQEGDVFTVIISEEQENYIKNLSGKKNEILSGIENSDYLPFLLETGIITEK